MKITYQLFDNAWSGFAAAVQNVIETNHLTRVCDIGGGANPALTEEFIAAHQIQYTLLDISQAELDKAPAGFRKVLFDVCDPRVAVTGPYDLVFSRMVAEHIRDARVFHQNIYNMLAPGGIAFHYFPTLYAIPFLANLLIPETLSDSLLHFFAPRNRQKLGKFPAFYQWTYGPIPAQIRRLNGVGFDILEYRSFYGHIYYRKIPLIRSLHRLVTRYLVGHPNPYLTSFAYLVLKKPAAS